MISGIKECREYADKLLKKHDNDLERVMNNGYINVSLILTHSCNLSCPYCYQSKEYKETKGAMSFEIAEQAIGFVYSSHPLVKDITISFFGGEPYIQFDLIKRIVEKYPQVNFSVTTNGYLLVTKPEYLEWTMKQTNLFVSISINGLKFKYGSNFLKVAEVLFPLLSKGRSEVNYVMDDPKEPKLFSNIKTLIDADIGVLRLSFPKESPKLITDRDEFIVLAKRICDLVYLGEKRPAKFGWDSAFVSSAFMQVMGKPLIPKYSSYCGAGWSYLAIDINGDIYPCDYFMQFPEKKLGDIFTGYKPGRKVFEGCDWPHDIFKHCTNCQFGDVQLCTNAMCYAENYKLYGDMLKPSELTCALKRLEFETYTYIATLVRDKGAEGGILDQTVC